jgi:RNA polymerase sigma-70 factor (ECF subfamily)
MYHIAFGILQDHFLAEDAVQTAFLKLEKSRFMLDSISCNKTRAFVVIIIRNIALQVINSKRRERVLFENDEIARLPDIAALPLELIISDESIERIVSHLNSMDAKYSDVLQMKSLYGLSNSEIANLFDVSEQLVRVRLFRARKMLMEKLNEEASYE